MTYCSTRSCSAGQLAAIIATCGASTQGLQPVDDTNWTKRTAPEQVLSALWQELQLLPTES